jgi:hypothetical protein
VNARGLLAAVLVGAVLLTGCAGGGDDEPSGEDARLPTAAEDQVTAQAQRYVDAVVTAVGTTPLVNADALVGGCEGRGGEVSGEDKFVAHAGGQIALPEARTARRSPGSTTSGNATVGRSGSSASTREAPPAW